MSRVGRAAAIGAAGIAAGVMATAAARFGGRAMVGRTEARLCTTRDRPPYRASDRARALHAELWVADLHADSLLWGRDLLQRSTRGHVDVPRLIEGNVALQVLAATTKSPRHLDLDRNDDRSDDVILLALALGWPPATWRRLLPRALHLAARADAMAARSDGRLTIIRSRADLASVRGGAARSAGHHRRAPGDRGRPRARRRPGQRRGRRGRGLPDDGPVHFFDNAFGGSAHGVAKGGLTDAGREMVRRMEARGMLVDVAHASPATIDDVLAMAARPVVASHTGLRGVADNVRNLTDGQLRGIAAERRGGRHRVLADGVRRRGRGGDRPLDPLRDRRRRRPTTSRSARTSTARCPSRSMRPAWSCSPRRCSTRASTTRRSRKVMGGNVRRLLADTLPVTQISGAMSAAARAAPSVSTGR